MHVYRQFQYCFPSISRDYQPFFWGGGSEALTAIIPSLMKPRLWAGVWKPQYLVALSCILRLELMSVVLDL